MTNREGGEVSSASALERDPQRGGGSRRTASVADGATHKTSCPQVTAHRLPWRPTTRPRLVPFRRIFTEAASARDQENPAALSDTSPVRSGRNDTSGDQQPCSVRGCPGELVRSMRRQPAQWQLINEEAKLQTGARFRLISAISIFRKTPAINYFTRCCEGLEMPDPE